jgi:hypothetical protein
MLSHITSAYSNRGLTNVKYIFSRVFRSNVNLDFLKIGTRLVSLNNLYMETDWEKLKIEEKNINLFNFTK